MTEFAFWIGKVLYIRFSIILQYSSTSGGGQNPNGSKSIHLSFVTNRQVQCVPSLMLKSKFKIRQCSSRLVGIELSWSHMKIPLKCFNLRWRQISKI